MRPPARVPGVSTQPGPAAVTVMLSLPSSIASERVSETSPALAAL
jgi:hypothetical protein